MAHVSLCYVVWSRKIWCSECDRTHWLASAGNAATAYVAIQGRVPPPKVLKSSTYRTRERLDSSVSRYVDVGLHDHPSEVGLHPPLSGIPAAGTSINRCYKTAEGLRKTFMAERTHILKTEFNEAEVTLTIQIALSTDVSDQWQIMPAKLLRTSIVAAKTRLDNAVYRSVGSRRH